MITKQFSLHPFSSEDSSSNLDIKASLSYHNHQLKIKYSVFGDLEKVAVATPINNPTRQDDLWQTTCFEFFLGIVGSPLYWEFNLSSSGNWNVYSFTGYREGMKPETAFENLPFEFSKQDDRLLLQIQIDTSQLITPSQQLEIAITTVIEEPKNNISYWALKHSGQQADFHLRDSFIKIA